MLDWVAALARDSGRRMKEGQAYTLRIGMGSGPGAMLMTPLLMHMATRHPKVRVVVAGESDGGECRVGAERNVVERALQEALVFGD